MTKRWVGQFVIPMQIYSYEVFPNNQETFEGFPFLNLIDAEFPTFSTRTLIL